MDGSAKCVVWDSAPGRLERHASIYQAGIDFAQVAARRPAVATKPAHRPLRQRSAMGQHRQSQGNDRQNTARQKSGKQQHADSDNASSRTSAAHGPQQQQQDPGTGRAPRGSGDASAPRAGGNRNADNPSLSANQQDRRGQSGSQRGGDSVEAPQDDQDQQDSKG
jgi:hypothetical protein